MIIEPNTLIRKEHMHRVLKTFPRLFVDHNGTLVEVTIADDNAGNNAVFVQAIEGNLFDMEHGFGEYITKRVGQGPVTCWYACKWVNRSDIVEK